MDDQHWRQEAKGPAQRSRRSTSSLLMKLLKAVVAAAGVNLADDVGQEAILSRSVPRAVGAASGCRLEQLWRTRSLTVPESIRAGGAASGCQLTQVRAHPVARTAVVAAQAPQEWQPAGGAAAGSLVPATAPQYGSEAETLLRHGGAAMLKSSTGSMMAWPKCPRCS